MNTDISIIIPVLNEQTAINQAVKNIHGQNFSGHLEVIVVDGSRQGDTIGCIQNQTVIKTTSRPGRGPQMNAGARIASGEILLFLHCDTVLPENALTRVQQVMKHPSVKAGAFDLSIDGKGVVFRMIEKTASLRSRITKIPYGDQSIFIRRAYFFEIGQYRDIPIMEDVDLMVRIKNARSRIEFINSRTMTSSRRWREEGVVYATLRNWMLIALFFCNIPPEKLAGWYKNKKD